MFKYQICVNLDENIGDSTKKDVHEIKYNQRLKKLSSMLMSLFLSETDDSLEAPSLIDKFC